MMSKSGYRREPVVMMIRENFGNVMLQEGKYRCMGTQANFSYWGGRRLKGWNSEWEELLVITIGENYLPKGEIKRCKSEILRFTGQ